MAVLVCYHFYSDTDSHLFDFRFCEDFSNSQRFGIVFKLAKIFDVATENSPHQSLTAPHSWDLAHHDNLPV